MTIIIICSLGNSYCTFGFLIFSIIERNFLYYSLYVLTEKSLKHLCSIRAWVPMSFFLSLSLSPPPSSSLSLSYHRLRTTRSQSIKGLQHITPCSRFFLCRFFFLGLGSDFGEAGFSENLANCLVGHCSVALDPFLPFVFSGDFLFGIMAMFLCSLS